MRKIIYAIALWCVLLPAVHANNLSGDQPSKAGAEPALSDINIDDPDEIDQEKDTDGDGFLDRHEVLAGSLANDAASVPVDTDGDKLPDALDADMDGDGVSNLLDTFPLDGNETSDLDGDGIGDKADKDRDGDGFDNAVERRFASNPNDPSSTPPDMDGDLITDALDPDRDGDNVGNEQDVFPNDKHEWADLDGDGIGNNADLDADGDLISNAFEVSVGTDPLDARSTPPDQDNDGIPNALDNDLDGDGVNNTQDRFAQNPNEWGDIDNDGIGDNADPDRDGDGFSNVVEQQAGTNDRLANEFPDSEQPVLMFSQWQADSRRITGMAFDEGMGIRRIWGQAKAGGVCSGRLVYHSHFVLICPHYVAADKNVTVWVEDRAGNKVSQHAQ